MRRPVSPGVFDSQRMFQAAAKGDSETVELMSIRGGVLINDGDDLVCSHAASGRKRGCTDEAHTAVANLSPVRNRYSLTRPRSILRRAEGRLPLSRSSSPRVPTSTL